MLQENEEMSEEGLKILNYKLEIGNQWFSYWSKDNQILKLDKKACIVEEIWENKFPELNSE